MNLKRMTAVMMAATMVLGSTVTAFAADGAEGQGTSFDHVNKEITSVTLPTDGMVANVFNFYVDPEGLIKDAAKLTDGTAVTGNDNGVYFKNTDGWSSSSDEVEFEGANSVDVDVTVTATVEAGEKSIALVESEEELAAATTPALLMNLTVGDDVAAIVDSGASAKAMIAGKADNFEVIVKDNKYVYEAKEDATDWAKTSVKLSGKTNSVDVPDGEGAMTAPKIVLTWSAAKHSDAPVPNKTTVSGTDNVVEFTNIGTATQVSSVKLTPVGGSQVTLATSGKYSAVKGDDKITLTFVNTVLTGNKGAAIVVEFDNGQSVNLSAAE